MLGYADRMLVLGKFQPDTLSQGGPVCSVYLYPPTDFQISRIAWGMRGTAGHPHFRVSHTSVTPIAKVKSDVATGETRDAVKQELTF
jgi:hypothetical protein